MIKISHDSEKPAKNQQVITATAFIHDGKGSLFTAKRSATKKFLPDVFELPGGHIDFGEEIVEGLKREVLEEFNMEIAVGDPFYTFTYINEIKGSHSIEIGFFARFTDPIDKIVIHPEDHSEWRWIKESDLPNVTYTPEELKAVRKGFLLLQGNSLNFG
jgi:8-oxo-dGTP diphosphatase